MCHFISWIEVKDSKGNKKICYLNDDCLKDSRGKELKEYLGNKFQEDVIGHGAINFYWNLGGKGIRKENDNPLNPSDLPDQIVKDLKECKFRNFGLFPNLLEEKAYKKYEEIEEKAYKKCKEIRDKANKEYKEIRDKAYKEYEEIKEKAYKEYEEIENKAYKEYKEIENKAYKEYEEIRDKAYKEYEEIRDKAFWKLFAKEENRIKSWK